MAALAVLSAVLSAFLLWPSPDAAAQTRRRVALVYRIDVAPLFAADGSPAPDATENVDALLDRLRSLESDHADDPVAISFDGVVCDELRLLDTDASGRAVAAIERIARSHRVLKAPYAAIRLEHAADALVPSEIADGATAIERCAGVAPSDPFVPPALAITSAERARQLREAGIATALSAFAVPPEAVRPRIVPAVHVRDGELPPLSTVRPEAGAIAVVADDAGLDAIARVLDDADVEVVPIAEVADVDVVGGVIDPSFGLHPAFHEAIEEATAAAATFDSYVLASNPLPQIHATVLARARSTATWRREGRGGEDDAIARARRLIAAIEASQDDIAVSEGTVTFTARQGAVPVTIANRARFPVRLRVSVASPKLDFVQRSRTVTVEQPGDTITFEAVARSTGTFPVLVEVRSPDGRVTFDRAEVTVRSAAANLSAVVLTAGGALFLAYTVIRRLRRRKRARTAT